MFGNLFMSMNNKLKKIVSSLETNKTKIDEISDNVEVVGTGIAAVQSISDEIKALIGTEIATQLSTLEANIIAAMPSGNSGLTSCIRNIQRGTASFPSSSLSMPMNITLSGFSDVSKMIVLLHTDVACDDTSYEVATGLGAYISSLTTTQLTLNGISGWETRLSLSYQIIEFY